MKLRHVLQKIIIPSWNAYSDAEYRRLGDIAFTATAELNFDFHEFMNGTFQPLLEEVIVFG